MQATQQDKSQWVKWVTSYDKSRLFDMLVLTIQGAKSRCVNCGEDIYCDIVEGGGIPDWGTKFSDDIPGLDYGCGASPDTNEDGTGGHEPERD